MTVRWQISLVPWLPWAHPAHPTRRQFLDVWWSPWEAEEEEVVARLFAEISPFPVYYSGQRIYCAVFHPNQLRVHVFLKDNNSRLSRAAVSPSPHGDADPSSKLAMQRGTRCTRITNSLKKPSRQCFFFTRW